MGRACAAHGYGPFLRCAVTLRYGSMRRDFLRGRRFTVSGRTELPSGLVTFMFTDIEGSTRLARMLGDDYGSVLGAHRMALRAALSDFGGVELFTEGDSFFVAFRDAGHALAACVEAQRRLSAHEWPARDAMPRVRMGMHTGYAKPIGDEYASIEVHRAARVAAAAHGGQVLCSGATALAVLTSGVAVPFGASIPAAPQLMPVGPTTATSRPGPVAAPRPGAGPPPGAGSPPPGGR